MDKLKGLLNHKFWLLFGLTLLVPLVGWTMASGNLQQEVADKTGEIDKAVKAVPAPGRETPNQTFVTKATELVDKKEKQLEAQRKLLWGRQQELMTWPIGMRTAMKEYEFEEPIADAQRLQYQLEYNGERDRILAILPAYNAVEDTGLVDVDSASLPFVDVQQVWRSRPPSPKQMWDAQMDNWFTESIFKALSRVNGSTNESTTMLDVPLRQVKVLEYHGGRKGGAADSTTAAATPEDAGLGIPAEGAPAAFDPFGNSGGNPGRTGVFGGSGEGAGAVRGAGKISISPALVFGDPSIEQATDGTGTEPAAAPLGAPLGVFGGRRTTQNEGRRYIEDDENLPYRTRGFYLHVVMRNEAVPELLLALSNMEWPTAIAHVHMAEMHPSEVEQVGSRGAGFNERRPGGLGRNPLGLGGNEGRVRGGDGAASANTLAAALEDKRLAEVVVCGIITIYTPPKTTDDTTTEATPSDETTTADETGDGTTGDGTKGEGDEPEETDGTEPAEPGTDDSATNDSDTDDSAANDSDTNDSTTEPAADPASASPEADGSTGTTEAAPASQPTTTP